MAAIHPVLAIRDANGVRARTPWNNEHLVRLLPPLAISHSVIFSTPHDRKSLRDNGVPAPSTPYLICTTPEASRWTYVHATPSNVLQDDLIARPSNAFVVHLWPDESTNTTRLRIHKRGKPVVNLCMRGIDSAHPPQVIECDAASLGPNWLKQSPTLEDAIVRPLNQISVKEHQGPALLAEGGMLRLKCDPADIDSVAIMHLRPWNPKLDRR